jgi:hypothetical protein
MSSSNDSKKRLRRLVPGLLAAVLATSAADVSASMYVQGTITEIAYDKDTIIFRVSNGVPTTPCTGAYGNWLRIPPEYKSMIAFVTGEWLRGNIPGVSVAVYATALDGHGFCTVSQIDPIE